MRDAVIVEAVRTPVGKRQCDGIRYRLQTMREGGGQANATILERL